MSVSLLVMRFAIALMMTERLFYRKEIGRRINPVA
jgi:hypothetical protein